MVEDALRVASPRLQPLRKEIRPPVIAIRRQEFAVCDRVTQCDDRHGFLGSKHVHAREEEPVQRGHLGWRQIAGSGKVSGRRNIRRLNGLPMPRRGPGVAGKIDADGEIRERRYIQANWVTEDECSCRNRDGAGTAERQSAIRLSHDGGPASADRDVRLPDDERTATEGVGYPNANAMAADACADHEP